MHSNHHDSHSLKPYFSFSTFKSAFPPLLSFALCNRPSPLCVLVYIFHWLLKVPYLCPSSPSPLLSPWLSGVLFMSQPAGLWMSLPPFYAQLLQNSLDCEGQSTHHWKRGKVPIFPFLFSPCLVAITYECLFLTVGCVAFSGAVFAGMKSIWLAECYCIRNKEYLAGVLNCFP